MGSRLLSIAQTVVRSAASGRKAAKDAVNTGRCDAFHEVARLGFEVRILVFVLLKRVRMPC